MKLGLLVLTVGFDSGLAAFGVVYVGTLLVLLWPRLFAIIGLGPSLIAQPGWLVFGAGATTPESRCGQ